MPWQNPHAPRKLWRSCMTMTHSRIRTGIVLGGLILAITSSAFGATTVIFDVPGAAVTGPEQINNNGDVMGSYKDGAGLWHGFLRMANGAITTIDVPGAAETFAQSMNNLGSIAGYWLETAGGGTTHSF